MIQFLKMDLIAACMAMSSLFGLHTPPAQAPIVMQTVTNPPPEPIAPAVKKTRHPLRVAIANLGIASWYGSVLHGHRTASGEIFDENLLTACHRTLPFGTLVRVVDVSSGKSVVVKINDRGVLSPDRIIDLSSAAAGDLGILRAGVAKVRLEILKKVASPQKLDDPGATHAPAGI